MMALHLPPQLSPLPLVSKAPGFKGGLPTGPNAAASTTSPQWQRFLAQVQVDAPRPPLKSPLSFCMVIEAPQELPAKQVPFSGYLGGTQQDCFLSGLTRWAASLEEAEKVTPLKADELVVQTAFNPNISQPNTPFVFNDISNGSLFGTPLTETTLLNFVPTVLKMLTAEFPEVTPLIHPSYIKTSPPFQGESVIPPLAQ